jgi:hypothetical protein
MAALCAALMAHAEMLESLLGPAWPDVEQVQEEMYHLVDTLVIHGVDQKWFSAFALIEEAEEMVTTPEICAVNWGSLFCVSAVPFYQNLILLMPQAAGNALINCIHAAHMKYESNPLDWHRVD